MSNIIRIEEGGVSNPYIVHERISQFAQPKLREGLRLIREQRGNEAYHLICEPIKDAVWEDIEPAPPKPSEDESLKGQNVDVKV